MPFGPSARSDLECTTAPTAAAAGVSKGAGGGVQPSAGALPPPVPAGSVGRSCSSPHPPPRGMVQRLGSSGGGRDAGAAAPRAYTGNTSNNVDVVESTLHNSPPPPTPPPPQAGSLTCGPSPAPRAASEGRSSVVTLPALTRATPTRASSSPHGIGASTAAAAGTSSIGGVSLPPVVPPPRASSSAAELPGEGGRPVSTVGEGRAGLTRASGPRSPHNTRAVGAPLPLPSSTSVAAAARRSSTSSEATVSGGSPHVAGTCSASSSSGGSSSAGSPSHAPRESYFRQNNIPALFNELSEALLDAQPEDPVAFMKAWLRRRREAVVQ
ncbi:hypothetical protein NESM_000779500 [Novymonas esmeraldas]|uniref:Uncharacterized protein n=1 Tax=Novymonas esmeraldas TaxID=1808958 RepID=A0AAW0EWN8_9TRYP